MNVLVTGADGFIGSHLVELLIKYGYKVRALSYYNSFNNWGWLEEIDCLNDIEVITGDIRDAFFCKKLLKDIDIVFHLAALIAIPFSYTSPNLYIETNIQGTLNLLQASLENNVKRFIHTSTSEVYGTAKYIPIDENHPLQPQSPYSASKIGADSIAMSFYHSFNLPVTIARPFNTYGPRQSARAVIPTIITQILNGEKEIKLGDTAPTRDFNYVIDTCEGFVALIKNNNTIGEVVNICSNYEISVKDTLELIKNITNSDVKFTIDSQRLRPKNSEVYRLFGDNSKIKRLTSWKPKYSLKKGLQETIKWFKKPKNLTRYKTWIYNV